MAKKSLKFADATKRQDHFRRHGTGVKAGTPSIYEAAAARFLSGSISAGVYEKLRGNGDRIRYNEMTQEFAVQARSGAILTYLIPEPSVHGFPTNLDYYHAQ